LGSGLRLGVALPQSPSDTFQTLYRVRVRVGVRVKVRVRVKLKLKLRVRSSTLIGLHTNLFRKPNASASVSIAKSSFTESNSSGERGAPAGEISTRLCT
jgi:hypothetical protein